MMPTTGRITMTTTQATREAGSRCGRRIARTTNVRFSNRNPVVATAARISFSIMAGG